MSYAKALLKYSQLQNKKSNQFIDDSLILCNKSSLKTQYVEQMRKGYEEMASINQELSEDGCFFELDQLIEYEAWLSESDMSDDDDDSEKRGYILC